MLAYRVKIRVFTLSSGMRETGWKSKLTNCDNGHNLEKRAQTLRSFVVTKFRGIKRRGTETQSFSTFFLCVSVPLRALC